MNSKELRQNFIDYFLNKRNHAFIRSSTVVPMDDPTLLFTNAGMNQFKDIFLDKIPVPSNKRAVNSQKCIRVSGKHNDLEEVGVDNYHHTFFEMLGNWSFGDYYKKEAIVWAWEYLTEELNLDKSRLWVTVYKDDKESEDLWKELTDIAHDRVLQFGDKDNFWEMGDVGPCGPCTEIHYFVGDDISDQDSSGVNSDELYREIWNLVFIQYNRLKNGELLELPIKHVDTGMGLERILSTINGLKDHYETDLFKPIISEIERLSTVQCIGDDGTPHRVIADHLRMLSFSIADGAMPSNDGRGYVVRRVLRRASRYGKLLGLNEPFIFKLVDTLCDIMGDAYPELVERNTHVKEVIKSEESSFLKTIDKGISIFNDITSKLSRGDKINGSDAFKLYDTYGFPLDLTDLLAKEKGLSVDSKQFALEMEKQKDRARKAGKFIAEDDSSEWTIISNEESSVFLGYEHYVSNSRILKYRKSNGYFQYILDKTPFYAESGGQIGDKGKFKSDNYTLSIIDTVKMGDEIVHLSESFDDSLINNTIECSVIVGRRNKTKANHSATHLLHSALKNILGDHVQQAGSLVSHDRLRFDLTHYSKISNLELENIENLVNQKIRESIDLDVSMQSFEDAKKNGAIAMFNEKYGNNVRVVNIPGFSKELCGGTHVSNTIEISLFKIISESALSKGVRRIEALTGEKAFEYLLKSNKIISKIKESINCTEDEVLDRFQNIQDDIKLKNKEIARLNAQNQSYRIKELIANSEVYNGARIIISKEDNLVNIKEFGDRINEFINKEKFIAVIATISLGKPMIMCTVSDQLNDILPADLIISKIAPTIEGGGGGKKSMSTAGGKNINKIDDALTQSLQLIKDILDE